MGLKQVGRVCQLHRQALHKTQQDVADATGYSRNHIATFEAGKVSNVFILSWYLETGLNPELVWQSLHGG